MYFMRFLIGTAVDDPVEWRRIRLVQAGFFEIKLDPNWWIFVCKLAQVHRYSDH